MSNRAKELNRLYLAELKNNTDELSVLSKVRELWWPFFIKSFEDDPIGTINKLDLCMDSSGDGLIKLAGAYATKLNFKENSSEYIQRINQFMKSNTGKMFERFVGLAVAFALESNDAPYCILPFRTDSLVHCHGLKREDFKVNVTLGNLHLKTHIDADLIVFNPEKLDADVYMVSIKSTLKDRFHNVPFWNLLRYAAINSMPGNVAAHDCARLKALKYIAICSDLAKEQPDFAAEEGPRNLIAIDAALLDGAYVTASRSKGLGNDNEHFGPNRKAPFYPLSCFVNYLSNA